MKNSIRREAAWAISNICAIEDNEAIKHIVKYPNLIEALIAKMYTDEKEVLTILLHSVLSYIKLNHLDCS